MTMRKPKGLKLYRALLTPAEVNAILAYPELPQPRPESPQLFRLFGDFGGKEADEPSEWMLEWGQRLVDRDLFDDVPNQYRLCDWIGELAGQFKFHVDNKRHGDPILAIALSDGRRIAFRDPQRPKETYEIDLDRGDGYLMGGPARWKYEHRIVPVGQDRGGGRSFIVARK